MHIQLYPSNVAYVYFPTKGVMISLNIISKRLFKSAEYQTKLKINFCIFVVKFELFKSLWVLPKTIHTNRSIT